VSKVDGEEGLGEMEKVISRVSPGEELEVPASHISSFEVFEKG